MFEFDDGRMCGFSGTAALSSLLSQYLRKNILELIFHLSKCSFLANRVQLEVLDHQQWQDMELFFILLKEDLYDIEDLGGVF